MRFERFRERPNRTWLSPLDDKTIDSINEEPLNGSITQSSLEQPQCHYSSQTKATGYREKH
jgi:hypothetical protein